jgi:hypothetical protein
MAIERKFEKGKTNRYGRETVCFQKDGGDTKKRKWKPFTKEKNHGIHQQ